MNAFPSTELICVCNYLCTYQQEKDSNAIKVMNSIDEKLGYINKTQAKKLAPKLDSYDSELRGTILEEGFYPGSAMLMKVARFF